MKDDLISRQAAIDAAGMVERMPDGRFRRTE